MPHTTCRGIDVNVLVSARELCSTSVTSLNTYIIVSIPANDKAIIVEYTNPSYISSKLFRCEKNKYNINNLQYSSIDDVKNIFIPDFIDNVVSMFIELTIIF